MDTQLEMSSGHRPVHTMTLSPYCFPSMGSLQQVPSEHQAWWNVTSISPLLVAFTHLFRIAYLSVETVMSVSVSQHRHRCVSINCSTKPATRVCTVLTGWRANWSSPPFILLVHDLNAVYTLQVCIAGYKAYKLMSHLFEKKKIHFGE